jgi:hypothetical protein
MLLAVLSHEPRATLIHPWMHPDHPSFLAKPFDGGEPTIFLGYEEKGAGREG